MIAGAPQSPAGTVELGKEQYAVGLIWFLLDDDQRALRQILDEADKETPPANLYVRRYGSFAQFGLGGKHHGHKVAQKSLAATIAAAGMPSWLVALPVGNGRWWVGSCYEGQIDQTGDALYGSEGEAKAAFNEFRAIHDAGRQVFCPESWEVAGAAPPDIRFFLRKNPPSAMLLPLYGLGRSSLAAPLFSLYAQIAAFSHGLKKGGEPADAADAEQDFETREKQNVGRLAVMALLCLACIGYLGQDFVLDLIHPKPKAPSGPKSPQPLADAWSAPWLMAAPLRSVIDACDRLESQNRIDVYGWHEIETACRVENNGSSVKMSELFGRGAEKAGAASGLWSEAVSRAASRNITLTATGDVGTVAAVATADLPPRAREGLWSRDQLQHFLDDLGVIRGFEITYLDDTKGGDQRDDKAHLLLHSFGHFRAQVRNGHGRILPGDIPAAPGVVADAISRSQKTSADQITLICYYRSGQN